MNSDSVQGKKFCKNFRAQGTIEYLVIIAIVVVISLVVVGLSTGLFNSSAGNINISTQKIGNVVGYGGISVVEVAVDSRGDGVLRLNNNSGDGFALTKVSGVGLGGAAIDSNFGSVFIPSSGSINLSLRCDAAAAPL